MKTYTRAMVGRARQLRKTMTPAEKRLWFHCLHEAPQRFRKQRPVGPFIVDFYCAASKLVIEVDGDSHFTEQGLSHDEKRTQFLEALGLTVLRFTNDDILQRIDAVKDVIYRHMKL